MPTNQDLERSYYLAAAGLTEAQAASMSISQLRAAYIAAGASAVVGLCSPSQIGLKGWTFDPRECSGTSSLPVGIEHVNRVNVQTTGSVSKLYFGLATLGAGLTAVTFVLRDVNGNLIAQWPDASTLFNTGSLGRNSLTLGTPVNVSAGGVYYVGLQQVGTTPAALSRANVSGINFGSLAAGPYTSGDFGAGGDTTVPASRTMSGMVSQSTPWWFGLA